MPKKLKSPVKQIEKPETQKKRAKTTKEILDSIESRQSTDSNNK